MAAAVGHPLALRTHNRGNFATPVLAFRTPDGPVIGVLYGTISDWVRNVQASGGVQVKRRGTTRSYRQPRLISRNDGLRLLPGVLRGPFRALGVHNFLRLSVSTPDHPAD